MIKELILNFFTVVGGALSIGIACDAYLVGPAQRKNIRDFLNKTTLGNNFKTIFYSYLHLTNATVFDRFFGGKFFSRRYFLNSFLLSLTFLFLIVLLQYVFNPTPFRSIKWSIGQVEVLLWCVFANTIVDWISIGQTQLLFQISSKLENIGQSVSLIIIDLILTINIFLLVYSTFLAAVIVATDLVPSEGDLTAGVVRRHIHQISYIANDANYIRSGIAYLGDPISGTSFLPNIDRGMLSGGSSVTYANTDDITLNDLVIIASQFVDVDGSNFRYAHVNGTAGRVQIRIGSPNWQAINDDDAAEAQRLYVRIRPRISPTSFSIAEGVAFQNLHALQDSFPYSLNSGFDLMSLRQLNLEYSKGQAFRQFQPFILGCQATSGNWMTGFQPDFLKRKCLKKISLDRYALLNILTAAKLSSSSSLQNVIPLNSLFMTSFMMTIVIYAFVIFLIIARFVSSQLFRILQIRSHLLSRGPFTLAAALIGFIFFSLTLW